MGNYAVFKLFTIHIGCADKIEMYAKRIKIIKLNTMLGVWRWKYVLDSLNYISISTDDVIIMFRLYSNNFPCWWRHPISVAFYSSITLTNHGWFLLSLSVCLSLSLSLSLSVCLSLLLSLSIYISISIYLHYIYPNQRNIQFHIYINVLIIFSAISFYNFKWL